MKWYITIIVAVFLNIIACSYPEGYKTIIEKEQYSIDVAGYLTKTRDLSTTPSLQYHNRFRTVYLVVTDKLKSSTEENFEKYHHNLIKSFEKQFGKIKVTVLPDTLLNGHKAIIEEIELKTDGEKVWYYIATLETDKYFYQVCSWTIDRRKEKYEADIRHMVNSFKEL
jgi:hypothetical protein